MVTGSSSGIGRETALLFARKGSKVIITYSRGKHAGEQVHSECKKKGKAVLFHLDVRDDSSIEELRENVLEEFGRVDVLINNAGVIRWTPLVEQSIEDIEEQIDVNLIGLIKVTRSFLPIFLEQGDGIIINIASSAGKQGFYELTTYCGTKFGVRGFTQALAEELPQGIRVYSINPGMTATRMTKYRGVEPRKVAGIIVKTAAETLGKNSGEDVDVWEYIGGEI